MSIRVDIATDNDEPEWNRFLDKVDSVHHAHCWEWRSILAKTFSHAPYYLIARDVSSITSTASASGQVVGILPLSFVRSVLFGKALISLPYLNAGGILAFNREAFLALSDKAVELVKELGAKYLELRHRGANDCLKDTCGYYEKSHKVAMTLNLCPDPEDLFQAFDTKLRNRIRRPLKLGMYAESTSTSSNRLDLLEDFYSVFSQNMRDLGTPVYPKSLFYNSMKFFGSKARCIVIKQENKPLAAAITIGHQRAVEIPWASSLRMANKLSPNMLLYWQVIKTACEDGYKIFDFGRCSPDSGTYHFKAQWGATPLPLHWYIKQNGGSIPDVSPTNPKFSPLVKCWQMLPLSIANTFGPWLSRSLP
ncbi:MAG: FemAB family PEP-CTERM system-associated protein [Deltaproteobacteria bacterium]|nr:FemAB family PEP-CTERM system-associated protein [Deltaproteobacteria bacterium]